MNFQRPQETGSSRPPIGFIIHELSGKLVHPLGGLCNPDNETPLVVHDDNHNPTRLQVRFVPAQDSDDYKFGYIEHVESGKFVHPQGGSHDPDNNTHLVYHSDKHKGALFRFDEESNEIKHISGKIWHPFEGLSKPGNDTQCVLHSDHHSGAKFYFGDIHGNHMSPYPAPKTLD